MADFAEDKVKVRFKFRSGDEFEAEGTAAFIEKQRADFLQLITQERSARTRRNLANASSATDVPTGSYTNYPTIPSEISLDTTEPAMYRQQRSGTIDIHASASLSPQTPSQSMAERLSNHDTPTITQGISAAERASLRSPVNEGGTTPINTVPAADMRLWEELVRTEDQMVFLRRKNRLLTPDTAALVLLAAARILLHLTDGYSALALSKSLKKSGYGGERLDRVLGGELKLGTVRSIGSKRSRLYYLSEEGFAKAYVLAEKLLKEVPR